MRYQEIQFRVAEDVVALGVTGVYFVMGGLENRASDPVFDECRRDIVKAVQEEMADGSAIKEDKVLTGFRELHTAVGRSNRDHVASPENLLKLISRTGELPQVNLLVDIYNLVSVQTRLALGAHDLATTDGNIQLKLTSGNERYWPLGAQAPKPVHAGEYAYVDDADDVICRLEVRQVEKTKVGLDTTECFYIVQGNRATDAGYVWNAAEELIRLTKKFCGGTERILYGP